MTEPSAAQVALGDQVHAEVAAHIRAVLPEIREKHAEHGAMVTIAWIAASFEGQDVDRIRFLAATAFLELAKATAPGGADDPPC